MRKTEIMKAINESNTNKEIKWDVLENTDTKIILTNDYDKSICFTIEVKHSEWEGSKEEWIDVCDNLTGAKAYVLIQGNDRWSDYKDTEKGLVQAVKIAVAYFNRRY